MIYQLAIYALGQKDVQEAVIIYPTMSEHATEARMAIRDPVLGGQRGIIALRPVNLMRLAALTEAGAPSRDQRCELARRLTFGSS